jgi:hypothetical protein
MELPDWIPKDAWDGWIEMRNKIKAPLTERAKTLAIKTLERLRDEGYEPGDVLDQSTMRSWRGLFFIYGQSPVMRDEHGKYVITPEGTRQYIFH